MGGYGLRLVLGFVAVVLVMLVVSGAVFVSVFGSYKDDLDRSELRTAANAVSIDIARSLARVDRRDELPQIIREHAERAGLIVLLLDRDGRVIEGFEPLDEWRGVKLDLESSMISQQWSPDGWFDSKIRIADRWRPVVAQPIADVSLLRRGRVQPGVILAVTFGDQYAGAELGELLGRLLISGLIGLVAAVVLALILTRSLVGPLRALTGVVSGFGPGAYGARAAESGPTQVRDLARAFNAMAGRVSTNERAMRNLIADVSHELRTPLTSIRGFAEALQDGTVSDPERQARSLEVIQQETGRMLRMVEQLLDLSRLEAGESRLQLTTVNPSELLEHVVSVFAPRAESQGLALRIAVATDAPEIEADYDRLLQVLSNVLDNALRHTSQGEITLTAQALDDGLELQVSDTGEGIAAEDLPNLFDRFSQPQSRSGPGAGLGLAISREIVRAHGGEIRAESPPGEGATITIRLPRRPSA